MQPGAADRDALGPQEAPDGGDGEAAPLHRRGQRDVERILAGSRKRRPRPEVIANLRTGTEGEEEEHEDQHAEHGVTHKVGRTCLCL